jgi:hypothetical protein
MELQNESLSEGNHWKVELCHGLQRAAPPRRQGRGRVIATFKVRFEGVFKLFDGHV